MGIRNGMYTADFPEGAVVRIVGRPHLERLHAEWKLHHPLQEKQLRYAGQEAVVRGVSFYHGGYELYELKRVPGTWHECCLRAVTEPDGEFRLPS